MGRLRSLPSRLGVAPSRLASARPQTERDRHAQRDAEQHWRRWYKTARWQRLRWSVLVRDHFRCQRCKAEHEALTALCDLLAPLDQLASVTGSAPGHVADHIRPHRGDEALFWDASNLQCLCKVCHDKHKQRDERRGIGSRGWFAMARPAWFRPSRVPLTIVVGAPGSGKSTWVRHHAGPGDLVICFDQIADEMFGQGRLNAAKSDPRIGDVLRRRNTLLGELMSDRARGRWPRAWLILTEPKPGNRQWWADRVQPERIVVMATPAAECARRCDADRIAGDRRREGIEDLIYEWWRDYAGRPGEVIVTPSR